MCQKVTKEGHFQVVPTHMIRLEEIVVGYLSRCFVVSLPFNFRVLGSRFFLIGTLPHSSHTYCQSGSVLVAFMSVLVRRCLLSFFLH